MIQSLLINNSKGWNISKLYNCGFQSFLNYILENVIYVILNKIYLGLKLCWALRISFQTCIYYISKLCRAQYCYLYAFILWMFLFYWESALCAANVYFAIITCRKRNWIEAMCSLLLICFVCAWKTVWSH